MHAWIGKYEIFIFSIELSIYFQLQMSSKCKQGRNTNIYGAFVFRCNYSCVVYINPNISIYDTNHFFINQKPRDRSIQPKQFNFVLITTHIHIMSYDQLLVHENILKYFQHSDSLSEIYLRQIQLKAHKSRNFTMAIDFDLNYNVAVLISIHVA